jgi:GTP-binding protein HflX|tara:strand:+ start:16747 stop:18081 length:1335 start_codon:yes stop_codon:yes gene_type:complete
VSEQPLVSETESHRGGFGELGGEERGFIDRTFRERIILVGLDRGIEADLSIAAQMAELQELVSTAGADVIHVEVQKRNSPDPATFIGRGKVKEIFELAEKYDADTVVFNDDLTPAQQNNLEKAFKRSAIDRTAVILDIFAQNASTPEGKAQVELAQLQYLLPRLRGSGISLSQQAGGIGTRGPGETKLEIDRRRLVRKVHSLQKQLTAIESARKNQSKRRRKSVNQSIAIVGYTNAGKSTLLNCLTKLNDDALVADRLFATLDPITRAIQLTGGERIYLSDTVGFVRNLPHHLVEAFKTTLDVVTEADLLIHVVDGSNPNAHKDISAVHQVLDEIDASEIPELIIFNKADKGIADIAMSDYSESVKISAKTGVGIEKMMEKISDLLRSKLSVYELSLPLSRGDLIAQVHREAQVLIEDVYEDKLIMRARLDDYAFFRLKDYISE